MAEHGRAAQWAHLRARQLTTAAGRATTSWRVQPDFLIVGAQRCGTTSLYKTLVKHPEIMPAGLHKGIHYFDTNYQKGPDWYRSHFPTTLYRSWRKYRSGARAITGEASPYYMFHPLAPQRISHDLPGIKLVVVLRDPVERAYSAHAHETARGFELQSFEDALASESERLDGEEERLRANPSYTSRAHQHNAYHARGHYIDQIESLEAVVGRDRLCVIDSDALFGDFAAAISEVLEFLQIEPWLPESFQQRNARPRSKLSGRLRSELEEYFEPYDARLADWWGRTPSWRR